MGSAFFIDMALVMTTRRVLSDELWGRLEPLLPDRTPERGGQWTEHRDAVEAII